ncbi:MAG TPA: type II toxin-antitoxin system VapC family toxin [Caulobacteraceae bacterium]|jgi:predicted nucleic acid-binding protein|nr:type II toxin-antitoxin system VapC family toxin [Caulobacteraceae bacterium]
MLVTDASVFLEWLLNDARAADAEAILIRAATEEIRVPPLCWLEVGNVLAMRMRRGKIDAAFRDAALGRMRAIGLSSDRPADPAGASLDLTLALADRFALTVYDAAYLELALRTGAELGTFDADLAKAARAAGVPVAPAA